jgi:hypothetical protein
VTSSSVAWAVESGTAAQTANAAADWVNFMESSPNCIVTAKRLREMGIAGNKKNHARMR